MRRYFQIVGLLLVAAPMAAVGVANEAIPYTVKSVVAGSAGFLELIGPGKVVVQKKVHQYRKGKYIRARNIQSLSDVEGRSGFCVLHYASHDYSENITVKQSCKQLLQVIQAAERQKQPETVPKFKIE